MIDLPASLHRRRLTVRMDLDSVTVLNRCQEFTIFLRKESLRGVRYNERLGGLLFMRTAPELESIRSSPRFRELVRRVAFPPSPGDKN